MPVLTRRNLLAGFIGAGAAGALASTPILSWNDVVLAANDRPLATNTPILVLITLYGGNDGLNTLVPFDEDAYHDARPELAYEPDEVLKLDGQYGLNPGLKGMAQMFDDGSLAIVRGVGYPNPDRSHFRSMDIWQCASVDGSLSTGWIGRWLDANGRDPLAALHFGRLVPTLALGDSTTAAVFPNEAGFSTQSAKLLKALSKEHPDDSPAMKMVSASYRAAIRVDSEFETLLAEGGPLSEIESGGSRLARQLDSVAACVAADVPTRVYSVELGGFDTHADEKGTQEKLLKTLDTAVAGFMEKVAGTDRGRDVVVMAYSEFGRRVRANSSDGTDHGTAGPVFILGNRVKGGFYGDDPSLTDLKDDDLKVTTDFRDVYNEILMRGLETDPEPILGKKRKNIGFLNT
ncbi:hypothetical protein FIV07_07860 [Mycobacterium sp. THAF192]|nr:hypothetical protein FIV07_07860 [Mycobacterium sp. THAF192]